MSVLRRALNEHRRLALPLGVLLAVNVAVTLLGVLPLRRAVTGQETAAADAKLALADAQRQLRLATDAQSSEERANRELRVFYEEVLPRSFGGARDMLFLAVDRMAREAGVQLATTTREDLPVEDSRLRRFASDVKLTGDYGNIRKFIYLVETSEEFFVIERVSLEQASDVQAASSGALDVTVVLATYYIGAGQP